MTNNMSKVKNMDATRMGNYGSTERSHIFVSNKNYGLSWKGAWNRPIGVHKFPETLSHLQIVQKGRWRIL